MAKQEINGLPIIDAKEPMTITVTDGDIARADRKEPLDCVVARACRRSGRFKEVRVFLSRIFVRTNDGSWMRYATPLPMRSDIIAFDRGGTFPPGTYVLKPPKQRPITGKRQGGKPKLKRAVAKKEPRHVLTDVRGGPFA